VGSRVECTKVLGLVGYRVKAIEWEETQGAPRLRLRIERRGLRGYQCSGCGSRTWRVRDATPRTWEDLPWATCQVTLVYRQRRLVCRQCGIRTERVSFADGHARMTRRLRRLIGLDCQSMPTSHAAVRHGVSWGKARRAERAFLVSFRQGCTAPVGRVGKRVRCSVVSRLSLARATQPD
jgi:transposase